MLLLLLALACTQPVETGDTGPHWTDPSTAPVASVRIERHQTLRPLLVVHWTQLHEAETWIEYEVEGEWLSTPHIQRSTGSQQQALQGVPPHTPVEALLVTMVDGERLESEGVVTATSGAQADLVPDPQVSVWDPERTSPEQWILGSIDVTSKSWYDGPFYLFVMDRQGRVVWTKEVPRSLCAMVPRVSRDGTHVVFNATSIYTHFDLGQRSILMRTTLDGLEVSTTEVPGNHLHFDEMDDGSVLLDVYQGDQQAVIRELSPQGTGRTVWNCTEEYGNRCNTNTINWVPERDTILYSQYQAASIMEVSRTTGEVLRSWGERSDWSFDPPEHAFHWQHYPTFTPEGHLLTSTHLYEDHDTQVVLEYEVDDESKTLRTVWSWGWDDPIWAKYSGEAQRLANGNTLVNYGTEGWIRELTPEGDVVWEVWFGDELLLGHSTLVSDLYALDQGGFTSW